MLACDITGINGVKRGDECTVMGGETAKKPLPVTILQGCAIPFHMRYIYLLVKP
jgi:hypothetical protein